jgi:hypothetical protein
MTTAILNPLTLFALILALGVLGIVIADTIIAIQEAQASRGCINPNAPGGGSLAFNSSKGRCAR